MAKAKQKSAPRVLTTMRLPEDLMEELRVVAAAEGRSRSNFVEHTLRREVDKHRKKLGDTVFA